MIQLKLLLLFACICMGPSILAFTNERSEVIAVIFSHQQSSGRYVTLLCGSLSTNMESKIFNNDDKIPYDSSGNITKSEINEISFHLDSVGIHNKCRFPKIRENFKFEQFTNVRKIDLSDVELETLEMNALRNAVSVKKLIASKNRLRDISPAFFPSTEQIEELDLTQNTIQRVDPTALSAAKSLKVLRLSQNQLSEIESQCFSVPTLEELDLTHNRLAKVHEDAFYGAINLKKLNMSYNVIGSLKPKTFARLTNLEVLSLQYSAIIRIESAMFAHQQKLISLDLSENWLTDLDFNKAFPPILPQIESINLRQNNLTALNGCQASIVPKLELLDIRSNDFNCSYLMQLMHEVSWNAFNTSFDESLTITHNPNIQGVNCKCVQKDAKRPEAPASDDATTTVQQSVIDGLRDHILFIQFSVMAIFVGLILFFCINFYLWQNGKIIYIKDRRQMEFPFNITLPGLTVSECKTDKK